MQTYGYRQVHSNQQGWDWFISQFSIHFLGSRNSLSKSSWGYWWKPKILSQYLKDRWYYNTPQVLPLGQVVPPLLLLHEELAFIPNERGAVGFANKCRKDFQELLFQILILLLWSLDVILAANIHGNLCGTYSTHFNMWSKKWVRGTLFNACPGESSHSLADGLAKNTCLSKVWLLKHRQISMSLWTGHFN